MTDTKRTNEAYEAREEMRQRLDMSLGFWDWCCGLFNEDTPCIDKPAINRMKTHILRGKHDHTKYVILAQAIATAVEDNDSQSLQDRS